MFFVFQPTAKARVVKWEKFEHVLLAETNLWELRTHLRTTANCDVLYSRRTGLEIWGEGGRQFVRVRGHAVAGNSEKYLESL